MKQVRSLVQAHPRQGGVREGCGCYPGGNKPGVNPVLENMFMLYGERP